MKKFVSFSLFVVIVILACIARHTANAQVIVRPARGVVTPIGRIPGYARIYSYRAMRPYYHRHFMYGYRWQTRPMRPRKYRW